MTSVFSPQVVDLQSLDEVQEPFVGAPVSLEGLKHRPERRRTTLLRLAGLSDDLRLVVAAIGQEIPA